MSRERIVELAQRIVEVRGQLAACEARLDELIGGRPATRRSTRRARGTLRSAAPRAGRRKPLGLRPGGLPARIVEFLGRSPSRLFAAPGIAKALQANARVVTATLARLSQEGRLRRVSRGAYRAA